MEKEVGEMKQFKRNHQPGQNFRRPKWGISRLNTSEDRFRLYSVRRYVFDENQKKMMINLKNFFSTENPVWTGFSCIRQKMY